MSKRDKAKSISKKLSNMARKNNIPYRNIMMSFYLERLLVRIIANKYLKDHLVFKGGYVGLRVYNSQRYTIDLDAVIIKKTLKTILKKVTLEVESDLNDCTWFKFQENQSLLTQGEHEGIRQVYKTGLGEPPKDTSRCDVVHFDIGVDDPIVSKPIEAKTSSILEGETLSWKVYPIESIIAEKIHAFISRNGDSSRSKDIFDLAFFLPKADKQLLKKAIGICFKNRNTNLPESIHKTMLSFDFQLAEKGWIKATSSLVEKITFNDCITTILHEIKSKTG